MSFQTKVIGGATALILSTALVVSVPTQASDAGAFVGGMLTSRVLGNMHQRTEAEQQQAYYAQQNSQQQQQVQQAAPAAPAAQTPTERMNELDKLAAGGYITPEEYKKKKQAIVDSM
jgi:hypothetical protein